MTHNDLVKNQFNRQAAEFDNWAVTKNLEYLKAIARPCAGHPLPRAVISVLFIVPVPLPPCRRGVRG
jgi:hypothetical protein